MFSVVIPLYNKAHVIERTLSTVLTQTFKEFEVIIVNDGSTDNGVEKIKNFTNDPRVKIIEQKNQGVSAARNKGVACSKYDYIAFIDGDDEWLPYFLEKIKEAIDLFPNAGMYGTPSWHRDYVSGFGEEVTALKYKYKIKIVDSFRNPRTFPHTSAIVVSKKLFNMIAENGEGFPVGQRVFEDFSCFYRIIFLAPLVYVGFPLAIRNNNVKGQITGVSSGENISYEKDIVNYYNITYNGWINSQCKNKSYLKFLKFDIRARIISALRAKDINEINLFLNDLNKDICLHFSSLELWMYRKKILRYISLLYIYYTKIMWRVYKLSNFIGE